MTDQCANPLANRRAAQSVQRSDYGNPSDIEGYCAWLNAKEWRRGEWKLTGEVGYRAVEWREEVASDEWLLENRLPLSMCPSDEKRARIAERLRWEAQQQEKRDRARM